MECYQVVEEFLNGLPLDNDDLGALGSALQNFYTYAEPTISPYSLPLLDASGHLTSYYSSEEEIQLFVGTETKEPPSSLDVYNLMEHLFVNLCDDGYPNRLATTLFILKFVKSLDNTQIAHSVSKQIAKECAKYIMRNKEETDDRIFESIVNLKETLDFLRHGDLKKGKVSRLMRLDMVEIIDQVTQFGEIEIHPILYELYFEVQQTKRILKDLTYIPRGLRFPYFKYLSTSSNINFNTDELPELKGIQVSHHYQSLLDIAIQTLIESLHQKISHTRFLALATELEQAYSLDGANLVRYAFMGWVKRTLLRLQLMEKNDENIEGTRNAEEDSTLDAEHIKVPSDKSFNRWQIILDIGARLFQLVACGLLEYDDIIHDFANMVKKESETKSQYNDDYNPIIIDKDNSLLWLILQLFHYEPLKEVISSDFKSSEDQFYQLIELYNSSQTSSPNGFYFRDLALQCAMVHQQENLMDRSLLKFRFPKLKPVLRLASITHVLANSLKEVRVNVSTNPNLFNNLDIVTLNKFGIMSQVRQSQLDQCIYINLIPNLLEYSTLLHPSCTYIQGGKVDANLLDLMPVNGKISLLNLIFSMALNCRKGPQTPNKDLLGPTCVSPETLDTVYRLFYSAGAAAEGIFHGLIETLIQMDSSLNYKAKQILGQEAIENELALIPADDLNEPLEHDEITVIVLRWQQSIFQLINHRMLRYLYNYGFHGLLEAVSNQLITLEHNQLYLEIEAYTVNIITLQSELDILIEELSSLLESRRFCFTSTYHAHITIRKIASIIQFRGLTEDEETRLEPILNSLHSETIFFDDDTLACFPLYLQNYYSLGESPDLNLTLNLENPIETEQDPNSSKLQNIKSNDEEGKNKVYDPELGFLGPFISVADTFELMHEYLELHQGLSSEHLEPDYTSLKALYSLPENQHHFLIMVFILNQDTTLSPKFSKLVKEIYESWMPSSWYDLTRCFIWATIKLVSNEEELTRYSEKIISWLFEYKLMRLHHLISVLALEDHPLVPTQYRFEMLSKLLRSQPFEERYNLALSEAATPRYWQVNNSFDETANYHKTYGADHKCALSLVSDDIIAELLPEYTLDIEDIVLPNYYSNEINRIMPMMPWLLGALIEKNQIELLDLILVKYSNLIRCHQLSYQLVKDLLMNYYASNKMDFQLKSKLINSLNLLDGNFNAPFLNFLIQPTDFSQLNTVYIYEMVLQLTNCLSTLEMDPNQLEHLPRSHYREIQDPVKNQLIKIQIELLSIPFDPITLQNLILTAIQTHLFTQDNLIAISLILAHLPSLITEGLVLRFGTLVFQSNVMSPSLQGNTPWLELLRGTLYYAPKALLSCLPILIQSIPVTSLNLNTLNLAHSLCIPHLPYIVETKPLLDQTLMTLVNLVLQYLILQQTTNSSEKQIYHDLQGVGLFYEMVSRNFKIDTQTYLPSLTQLLMTSVKDEQGNYLRYFVRLYKVLEPIVRLVSEV